MDLSANTALETSSAVEVSKMFLGKNGSNPLPMIEKLWDFYSSKGNKTVFLNVGTSSSPLGELEIVESLGCPLHVIEPSASKRELWNKVVEILKTRKETDETRCDFTSNVSMKWVLGKNVLVHSKLPYFTNGSVHLEDGTVETEEFSSFLKSICKTMNLSEENTRVDLINLQLNSSFERAFLYGLIESGFRPGLLLVSYTSKPDSNLLTTQVAAHLQNVGYQLIIKEENKFVYLYNDKNLYEITSYENTSVDNPLMFEILKAAGFYDKNKKNKN
jgi:hypothetical protein